MFSQYPHKSLCGVGSMPPHSQYLWQEGMCVKSFKLVCEGNFQEEGWCVVLCGVVWCVCACVHACVCVCVCEREGGDYICVRCVSSYCDLKHYCVGGST